MAIIGNNDVSTVTTTTTIPWEHEINTVDTFVCTANQKLTELHIRSNATGGTSYDFELGVYDITDGANNAPLVYVGLVTVDRSIAGVYSTTGLDVDLSAYEGRTLAIAHSRMGFSGFRIESGTMPQSLASDFTLDDPFVQANTTGGRWYGMWAVTETVNNAFHSNTQEQFITTSWNGSEFDSTIAYTVPEGADVVSFSLAGSMVAPSQIEFNGVTANLRVSEHDGNAQRISFYDVVNPTPGAGSLYINTGGNGREYSVVIRSLHNVGTDNPVRDTSNHAGWLANTTNTLTTEVGDLLLDVVTYNPPVTATKGSDQIQEITDATGAESYLTSGSYMVADTTSETMQWTLSAADWANHMAIAYAYRLLTRTIYVDTDATGTGDGSDWTNAYTSLDAALTAEARDLTVLNEKLSIYCRGTTADTTNVTLLVADGWVTSEANRIDIYGDNTSAFWDATKYRLEYTWNWNPVLDVNVPHVYAHNIQILNSGTTSPTCARFVETGGLLNCIERTGSGGTGVTISGLVANSTFLLVNNICYDVQRAYSCSNPGTNVTLIAYNNLAVGCSAEGINFPGVPNLYLKNNISVNNLIDYNVAAPDETGGNIASDTSSPDNTLDSITLTFVDSASGDYRLAASDTDAIDVGLDLSADSQYAFSTDITGATRTTWDIGPYEYALPTWGNTTEGSNSNANGGSNLRVTKVPTAMPENGKVVSLSAWVGEVNSTNQRVKFGIYDTSDNVIAETEVYAGATIGATPELVTLNIVGDVTLDSATDYYLGILFESASSIYTYEFVTNSGAPNAATWPNFNDPLNDPFDIGHQYAIYANYAPLPTTVAHYKLDETTGTTAADEIGSNDLTLTGFPASPWVAGKNGNGLQFDGVDDAVAGTALNPANITLGAWYEVDTSGAVKWYGITAIGDCVGLLLGSWNILDDKVSFFIHHGSGSWTSADSILGIGALTPGFHHLAGTFNDTTKELKVYLDFVEVGSATSPSSIAYDQNQTVFTVGNLDVGTGADRFFKGVIDDVRVYDQVLSLAEITSEMQVQAGGTTATVTGTIINTIDEDDISAGGQTIILTLSGDTWAASGAAFDAQRQAIIDGIVSAQSETNGWNAVRANIPVSAVVRTSDTVVTITLPVL